MKTIHHVLDIDADVAAAWDALTTEAGLAGWWTPQVSVEEAGAWPRVSFVFGGDFNPVMQVTEAADGQRLVWRCIDGHDNWKDNTFTFGLAGLPDGRTRLRFTQDYATELSDDDYGIYNFNWGYYLESLRLLLTTGTGQPYRPEHSQASVVRAYLGAWQDRDFPAMRRLVADSLRFAGPIDTFDQADAHHAAVKALSGSVDHIEVDHMWSDGADVLAWYTLHTTMAGPAPVAEWYHVDGGQITAITVVFDARPFAAVPPAAAGAAQPGTS